MLVERLHPKVANWRSRPVAVAQLGLMDDGIRQRVRSFAATA